MDVAVARSSADLRCDKRVLVLTGSGSEQRVTGDGAALSFAVAVRVLDQVPDAVRHGLDFAGYVPHV